MQRETKLKLQADFSARDAVTARLTALINRIPTLPASVLSCEDDRCLSCRFHLELVKLQLVHAAQITSLCDRFEEEIKEIECH